MSTFRIEEFPPAADSENIGPAMARDPNPESVEACGRRLEATRIALGLSQAEICRQTGITPQAWNNAETGDNRLAIENAYKICRRYGLTTDWLYRGDIRQIPAELAKKIAQAEAERKPAAKRA